MKPRALGFYRGQAYRAATCGISVDVHCFANKTCEHFGLSSMVPLAFTTGGGIYRWEAEEEGTTRPLLLLWSLLLLLLSGSCLVRA